MIAQLSIDDAIAAGHSGAEQASENSGAEWLDYATAFLKAYLEQHDTMFVDDLWSAGLTEPVSGRALGHIIATAKRDGWIEEIEPAPGFLTCRRSTRSNGAPKCVWRSLLR